MIITVIRDGEGKQSTLSEVYVDGIFFCYGLEDAVRDQKIWGATAIPAGTYKLGMRKLGALHARYTRLFPKFHRGMIEILNIPDFRYVYIHIGNTIGDTSGCLLLGDSFVLEDGDYELRKSKAAYKRLYQGLSGAVESGQASVQLINAFCDKPITS